MKKGKIIVIDGTDGSGKATQAKLLYQKLKKSKIPTEVLDFPQYQTFFGKLVSKYLKNQFGKISPYLASVLYAVNRLEFRDKINLWLKQGKIIILNRYVSSNQIHQAAHIDNRKERKNFVKWIGQMEYEVMGMPKPDLVLFLNMPTEFSFKLILKKDAKARAYIEGAKRDMLESDYTHQQQALKQSFEMLNSHYKWEKIDCVQNGKLLIKQTISDQIWQQVSKLIK